MPTKQLSIKSLDDFELVTYLVNDDLTDLVSNDDRKNILEDFANLMDDKLYYNMLSQALLGYDASDSDIVQGILAKKIRKAVNSNG